MTDTLPVLFAAFLLVSITGLSCLFFFGLYCILEFILGDK